MSGKIIVSPSFSHQPEEVRVNVPAFGRTTKVLSCSPIVGAHSWRVILYPVTAHRGAKQTLGLLLFWWFLLS